jgi:hypothetical protein
LTSRTCCSALAAERTCDMYILSVVMFPYAQLPVWQTWWVSYAEGEALLQKQRFVLPTDWLFVSNLEGELRAVEQAAGKKSNDMTNRIPALRLQVWRMSGSGSVHNTASTASAAAVSL